MNLPPSASKHRRTFGMYQKSNLLFSHSIEDQQHNLWMIADGKLYKDSLESK